MSSSLFVDTHFVNEFDCSCVDGGKSFVFVPIQHDSYVDDDANEDKVKQWLEDLSSSKLKEKKPFLPMTPRAQSQTPYEVVENDTISDLSETFTSVVSS